MEPSGCNQWQSAADRPAAEAAETTEMRRLPPVAVRSAWYGGGRSFDRWDGLEQRPRRRPTHSRIVPEPAGTRGYDDPRRAATREPLGRGVRPSVASIGDLARMVSALGDEERLPQLMQLRRLVELERARERVVER
jgi:hypothetical protein